jgi:hypothetical protein
MLDLFPQVVTDLPLDQPGTLDCHFAFTVTLVEVFWLTLKVVIGIIKEIKP